MKNILLFILTILSLHLISCNDVPLDPILFGSLEGTVLDQDDQSVITGVLVSTAPASNSLITEEEGKFLMEEIPVGEYEIILEKSDYINSRETVIISEGVTTQITILLQKKSINNSPPNLPTSESPNNLAEDIDLDVELTWTGTDPNPTDSITYDVLLYSDNIGQFQTIASDIRDESFLLSGLTYETTYFWQIIIKDGVNDPINGPIWQFKTKPFPENRILFSRRVNNIYQIFSGDENGNEVQLTYSPTPVWRARYNPQKSKIAFISLDGIEKHLYIMNSDGSEIEKVTQSIPIESFDEDFMSFCWSPNGSSLVYMNYNRLYKIFPDGSGLELIKEISSNFSFTYCDWTLNPQPKLMVRTGAANQYDGELMLMDLNGSSEDQIFENTPGRIGGGVFSLCGTKILFTHDLSGFEGQDGKQLDASIHILDLLSNNSFTNLSIDKPQGTNDLDPRYSPDGASIIFTNTNNDGTSVKNIYKMDLLGNRELLLSLIHI